MQEALSIGSSGRERVQPARAWPEAATSAVPPIEDILDRLVAMTGSDLILSCGSPPRVRVDGSLCVLDLPSLEPSDCESLIHDVLDDREWERLRALKSVDFSFTWRDKVRIRGNAYFQRGTPAAAFRLLPLLIPSFDELGIPEPIRRLVDRRSGLILVTGPTGSGKSTTQAALIDHINHTRPCHVVTVEDPVEYVHEHLLAIVDQRQIGPDVPGFAEALRSVFREDPDVVQIGEMRDLETISSALTIAETGHLVLATLHTNDASQTIDRILDGFPPNSQQQARIQLAACLTGVIYQQLIPAIDGGRVAAFEILLASSAVRALIKDGKTNQIRNFLQTNSRDGNQTLERSLTGLIASGVVNDEDARMVSLYPEEIGI